MAWADVANLANKAVRSAFGESVTVGGASITAVYSVESTTLQPASGGTPIVSNTPVIEYRTADLVTQPTAGMAIVAGGVSYKALKVLPDGQGWTRVQLREAT